MSKISSSGVKILFLHLSSLAAPLTVFPQIEGSELVEEILKVTLKNAQK